LSIDRQRIDKWLWHARVVRTRSAAAALAAAGAVRVNGERITAASRLVRPGDVLTIALDSRVRVVRVAGFAERRGAAPEAAVLFEEIEALSQPKVEKFLPREPGTGRPTKHERRALDRLRRESGE
jgi:ribosome-associated heat shock protein Hsp15